MKNTQSKIKPIKIKKTWNHALFRGKDYTDNFKPQKKSLEKNQTVLFVDLVNQEF